VDVPGGSHNGVADEISGHDVGYLVGISAHAPHESNAGSRDDPCRSVDVVDPPGDRFVVCGHDYVSNQIYKKMFYFFVITTTTTIHSNSIATRNVLVAEGPQYIYFVF